MLLHVSLYFIIVRNYNIKDYPVKKNWMVIIFILIYYLRLLKDISYGFLLALLKNNAIINRDINLRKALRIKNIFSDSILILLTALAILWAFVII